jgi:hypothetical protein
VLARGASLGTVLAIALAFAACETHDDKAETVPYVGAVEAILETRCVRCHADPAPPGEWRADSYVDAIGCGTSGPVTFL